jgi:hypothetical protein
MRRFNRLSPRQHSPPNRTGVTKLQVVSRRPEPNPLDRTALTAEADIARRPVEDIEKIWNSDLLDNRELLFVIEATGLDHGQRWRDHLTKQADRARAGRRTMRDVTAREDEKRLTRVLDYVAAHPGCGHTEIARFVWPRTTNLRAAAARTKRLLKRAEEDGGNASRAIVTRPVVKAKSS